MVVYEGPSMLNGKPIVAIITGLTSPSKNRKTGPMAQLWILDASSDESVCGDCPARGKWCYVTTFQGPLSIYRSWKRGTYEDYNPERLRGVALRLGAYGDPAALPIGTVRDITRLVDRFTGYTHQWKNCDSQFQHYCMAPVDTASDQAEAARRGWRTFRVAPRDSGKLRGEVTCPASDEAGHKLDCFTCGACDGRRRPRVKSHIVIAAHGAKTKRYLEEFGNAH